MIIDNNVLFSLMKPDSTSSYLFESIKTRFFVPSFVVKEFRKYRKECMKKSGLNQGDFKRREKQVFDKIKIIDFDEYKDKLDEAERFSPDLDDSAYFALALRLDLSLWSNDVALKDQDRVKVLSTEDLVKLIF